MELGTVTIEDGAQPLRARLVGEFDLANAPTAEEEIMAALPANQPDLVLDLRAVTFMDSTMLHTLVHLRDVVLERRGTIALEAGTQAERTLRVAGLDQTFEIRVASDPGSLE